MTPAINLLATPARPEPVDALFYLRHIESGIPHTDDLGKYGSCLIAYSDRAAMDRYSLRHGLVEYCEIVCRSQSDVILTCDSYQVGLCIDNRMILVARTEAMHV